MLNVLADSSSQASTNCRDCDLAKSKEETQAHASDCWCQNYIKLLEILGRVETMFNPATVVHVRLAFRSDCESRES